MFNDLYAYYDGRLDSKERSDIEFKADKSLFFYETRHDDEGDFCTPVTIEKSVFVNFCNTIIFTKPLQFNDTDFIIVNEDDWDFDFPQISLRGDETVLTYLGGSSCHML